MKHGISVYEFVIPIKVISEKAMSVFRWDGIPPIILVHCVYFFLRVYRTHKLPGKTEYFHHIPPTYFEPFRLLKTYQYTCFFFCRPWKWSIFKDERGTYTPKTSARRVFRPQK